MCDEVRGAEADSEMRLKRGLSRLIYIAMYSPILPQKRVPNSSKPRGFLSFTPSSI